MTRSVSNIIMRNVLNRLKNDGINPKPIIDYCGISDYEIEKLNGRIPESKHYRFMLKANQYIEPINEIFLEKVIERSFRNFPDFISICLNEETAENALDVFMRYRVIIGNCDNILKTESFNKKRFEYVNMGPEQLGATQAIHNFIMIYSIAKSYQHDLSVEIGFIGKPRSKSFLLDDFFKTKCLWGQESNYICFKYADISISSGIYNPTLHILQENRLNEICSELELTDRFSSLIKDMIKKSISEDQYTNDHGVLDHICNTLNISRWTLNRRLQNESASFLSLLKDVKVKESCRLLTESAYSIQEIGDYMGFSSQSVFSRFFKSHVSVSPMTFRAQHKNQ
ncbi:helix-turn-helix domain-containing protein [Tolumonas osonensis]|uniref:AraC-like DNA-binding protein n=1 Tax=Tolumonas osonensis TaxID=675874 RepID=A0A841GHK9_9GAMM|nr:helix-turn-helix domain-containing protein [Tolumonas osonensis]MBB6054731.1 AraC-like DNA-binding protein [Tolumonas osonensis]